ncbi:MAG: bifunctional DNA-formamidopyrimidine glycosylase/DNA-(apurinic or apyrimidinic site) lyase [Patescibacteria group bacterium]
MPELPEVETIRKGLVAKIKGKTISDFESRDSKVVQLKPEDVIGAKILNVDRIAKMLLFKLDSKKSILIHMKMTGQLIWEKCAGEKEFCLRNRTAGGHPSKDWHEKMPGKYTRAIFHFDDESVLYFNDLRRFGYVRSYSTEELKNLKTKELANIGIDPFSSEFSVEYLKNRAKKIPNRPIKLFLMDQSIIAGIGNIYADESLFCAGIIPTRKVKDIKDAEWKKIISGIIKSLKLGLKYGGSSADTYVKADGTPGEAHKHLKVYRKTGENCPKKCGGKIKRITLGGRGTHFCPACQR